jgi:[acyl-carrier-protein] S-malonyltransferase
VRAGLFPGQGVPAAAVLDALPEGDELLAAADELLGYPLRRKIEAVARRTSRTLPTSLAQPAIFVGGLIAHRKVELAGDRFDLFAGHSIGEYTALVAAGAMPFASGLSVVRVRAEAMEATSRSHPGGMVALLGPSLEQAEDIARRAHVEVANDNAPGQVVLSGPERRLAEAAGMTRDLGGRAVLLEVAGPFHTPAMRHAAAALRDALDDVELREPSVPLVANVTASPFRSPEDIRRLLVEQLTARVRFRESIAWMSSQGAEDFDDLGPGKVVEGLARKTLREVRRGRGGTSEAPRRRGSPDEVSVDA